MATSVFKNRRCGWSGPLKKGEHFCWAPVTERVRYHHDGYENDKYLWACKEHADKVRE